MYACLLTCILHTCTLHVCLLPWRPKQGVGIPAIESQTSLSLLFCFFETRYHCIVLASNSQRSSASQCTAMALYKSSQELLTAEPSLQADITSTKSLSIEITWHLHDKVPHQSTWPILCFMLPQDNTHLVTRGVWDKALQACKSALTTCTAEVYMGAILENSH